MSITYNLFGLKSQVEELKKHSSDYLKMKIDAIPGVECKYNGGGYPQPWVARENERLIYYMAGVSAGFSCVDTIYHVLMKINPMNISLKQWLSILDTMKKMAQFGGPSNHDLSSTLDIDNINKYSPIIFKYVIPKRNGIWEKCGNSTRISIITKRINQPTHRDLKTPLNGYSIRHTPSSYSLTDSVVYISKNGSIDLNNETINPNYTLSECIYYRMLTEDAYSPNSITYLKNIHSQMTDEPPIIGWDDDKLEYIHRTDDDSPFITKSELWELIQKLERNEDILPRKRTPNPTPLKELAPPESVKCSSADMEPGRIRSKKTHKPFEIKETIKETTGYVNPYEGLDEASSSDDSIETIPDELEIKTKIDPKMLDCIVFDHEPVKPIRLSYTAENVNIFLVVYAFIMTVLVVIGMARR